MNSISGIIRLGIRDSWLSPAMGKKAVRRLWPTVVWLIIVSLLRLNWQISAIQQVIGLVYLWLGAVAGTFLLDIDHLLYLLVTNPQELTSMRVKRLITQKRIGEGLDLMSETNHERLRLPFHNALFQPVLYVLCFFVLTSTGSMFGAGLVMAMALHLLKEEFEFLFRGKEEQLKKWLFWQIKGEISLNNQRLFVVLMLLVFLGLNLFLI